MNVKQITFLRLLLEQEEYLPVSFYAGKMRVSDKTVRRMLSGVNVQLAAYNGSIRRCPGTGIRLEISGYDRERLMCSDIMADWLDSDTLPRSWVKLSRRMDIALNLLLYSDEPASITGLAYRYYVSRSSIAGDLKALGSFADKNHLVIRQNRYGISLDGRESSQREALVELLLCILGNNMNLNVRGSSMGEGICEKETLMTILDIFTENDLSFVEGLLRDIGRTTDYRFNEREYMAFSLSLLVMIYRLRNGFSIEPVLTSGYRRREDDRMGVIALELASRLNSSYGYALSVSETAYIYHALSMTHMGNFLINRKLPEKESRKTAIAFGEDFIDAFSVITGINLRAKSSFYVNVISHITLMLDRAAANAPVRNPIIDLLLDHYKSTINVCQIICRILAEKFSLPDISFDEICYLMLYIQGELLADEEEMEVILICNMSNSIVNILKHKILQQYPHWSVMSCDYNRFLDISQRQYDLILSTVPLSEKEHVIPYVLISPLLDDKDCAGINNVLKVFCHREDLYLRELIRTKNDLNDIGCAVEVRTRNFATLPWFGFMNITALKGTRFVYIHNHSQMNRCEFAMDMSRKAVSEVIINMSNWDFMLLASKLVYLLDNCPDWVMEEFVKSIITEEK